jgi:hypothetical protein
MSQQTINTQVAEPPAPLLPGNDSGSAGDANRRKLQLAGVGAGIVVIAIVAFFLLKGGGAPATDAVTFVPHHTPKAAAAAQPPVVKLPKHVTAPAGRDPFKALYTAPVAAAAGSTTTPTGGTSTTPTTPTTSTTTTAPAPKPTYQPVWVKLHSITTSTATLDVGYSNGKTLRAVRYTGVKVSHTFAGSFELLSVRNGVATLKFGDGSPFMLDRTHNFMVVG